MTPGSFERAMAWSISVLSVTQTGQPGPENISTVGGSICLMPYRCMAWVWVPQNSITLMGFFDAARMRAFSFSTTAGSRKVLPVSIEAIISSSSRNVSSASALSMMLIAYPACMMT